MKAPHTSTRAIGKAGLAVGTTSTYTVATAISCVVRGKYHAFSTKTNQATPTTDASTGAAFPALAINQGTVLVFGSEGGTIKVAQGSIEALDAAGNFRIYPKFPDIPATMCPFGYVVVKNDATGGAWTFGTSNWNATGITTAAVDVETLPARPQAS